MPQLYAYGEINKSALEERFAVAFDEYFAGELRRLEMLAADGLVHVGERSIRLSGALGRLLVRVVAAVFDRYLPGDAFHRGLPANLSSRVG